MNQTYSAKPGVSLPSISLGSGIPIKAVTVDNDTGGWLFVVESQDWIGPYVHGWGRDLTYAGQAITVNYSPVGPTNQVTTIQGDGYQVTLWDSPQGNSAGDPTYIPTTQSDVTTFEVITQLNTLGLVLIPSVTGKVIRLLYAACCYVIQSDIPAIVTLAGAGSSSFIPMRLAGNSQPSDELIFPDKGIYLPISVSLKANIQCPWVTPVLPFPFGVVISVFGQYAYV